MISITGVDLFSFAQKVYELSQPQGLGFLHYTSEPLTKEEYVKSLRSYNSPEEDGVVISLDYVKGRACKMTVWRKGGDLQIRDSWYDHTDSQFDELLSTFNITKGEHGAACNCSDCRDR